MQTQQSQRRFNSNLKNLPKKIESSSREHTHLYFCQAFKELLLTLTDQEIYIINKVKNSNGQSKDYAVQRLFQNRGLNENDERTCTLKKQLREIIGPDFQQLAIQHITQVDQKNQYQNYIRGRSQTPLDIEKREFTTPIKQYQRVSVGKYRKNNLVKSQSVANFQPSQQSSNLLQRRSSVPQLSEAPHFQQRATHTHIYPCQAFRQFLLTLSDLEINMINRARNESKEATVDLIFNQRGLNSSDAQTLSLKYNLLNICGQSFERLAIAQVRSLDKKEAYRCYTRRGSNVVDQESIKNNLTQLDKVHDQNTNQLTCQCCAGQFHVNPNPKQIQKPKLVQAKPDTVNQPIKRIKHAFNAKSRDISQEKKQKQISRKLSQVEINGQVDIVIPGGSAMKTRKLKEQSRTLQQAPRYDRARSALSSEWKLSTIPSNEAKTTFDNHRITPEEYSFILPSADLVAYQFQNNINIINDDSEIRPFRPSNQDTQTLQSGSFDRSLYKSAKSVDENPFKQVNKIDSQQLKPLIQQDTEQVMLEILPLLRKPQLLQTDPDDQLVENITNESREFILRQSKSSQDPKFLEKLNQSQTSYLSQQDNYNQGTCIIMQYQSKSSNRNYVSPSKSKNHQIEKAPATIIGQLKIGGTRRPRHLRSEKIKSESHEGAGQQPSEESNMVNMKSVDNQSQKFAKVREIDDIVQQQQNFHSFRPILDSDAFIVQNSESQLASKDYRSHSSENQTDDQQLSEFKIKSNEENEKVYETQVQLENENINQKLSKDQDSQQSAPESRFSDNDPSDSQDQQQNQIDRNEFNSSVERAIQVINQSPSGRLGKQRSSIQIQKKTDGTQSLINSANNTMIQLNESADTLKESDAKNGDDSSWQSVNQKTETVLNLDPVQENVVESTMNTTEVNPKNKQKIRQQSEQSLPQKVETTQDQYISNLEEEEKQPIQSSIKKVNQIRQRPGYKHRKVQSQLLNGSINSSVQSPPRSISPIVQNKHNLSSSIHQVEDDENQYDPLIQKYQKQNVTADCCRHSSLSDISVHIDIKFNGNGTIKKQQNGNIDITTSGVNQSRKNVIKTYNENDIEIKLKQQILSDSAAPIDKELIRLLYTQMFSNQQ